MSKLYRVRVDECEPPNARLTVWRIHPDAEPPKASLTLTLGLLCDGLQKRTIRGRAPSRRSPLAQALDTTGMLHGDESWMLQHAGSFLQHVSRKSSKNPRPRAESWSRLRDGDLSGLTQAVLELTATDAAWVSHLQAGLEWDSSAWDMGRAEKVAPRRFRSAQALPRKPDAPARKIAPAPSPPRSAAPGAKKNVSRPLRLELVRGASAKYWEIEVRGKILVTRYGRIGSSPRETVKSFDSVGAVTSASQKLIAEKRAKGYTDVASKAFPDKKARAKKAAR